jgi:hypothetical protein
MGSGGRREIFDFRGLFGLGGLIRFEFTHLTVARSWCVVKGVVLPCSLIRLDPRNADIAGRGRVHT